MDISKLFELASRFKDAPDVVEAVGAVALDLAVLIDRIRDNHVRAAKVLTAGDQAELDGVHAETLAMIDAFDAELAKAAQS